MSLREDVELYEKLSGEDGGNETIATIGAYLRGYSQGKEDAEPHWTPVTEEPKESGKYLVTAVISFIPDHVDDPDTYEAVTTANYLADIRGSIKWWGNNVEKVLAWMPLPEPMRLENK